MYNQGLALRVAAPAEVTAVAVVRKVVDEQLAEKRFVAGFEDLEDFDCWPGLRKTDLVDIVSDCPRRPRSRISALGAGGLRLTGLVHYRRSIHLRWWRLMHGLRLTWS